MPPLLSLLVTLGAALAMFASSAASVVIVTAAVLTVVWIAARRAIGRSLPERVRIEPASDFAESPATHDAIADLEERGFVRLGGPQVPNLRPAPIVFPLVHRERGLLAAVYQLRRPLPRTIVDLVTTFTRGEVLTTSNAREAATLPRAPEHFLQTKPSASVDALLALHQDGVATLRAIGLRTESTAAVSIADFVHALARHVHEQRDQLDQAPVRTTAIALWRTLFGCTLHERPLDRQLGDGRPVAANASS